jgi:hypothetical protein
MAAVACDLDNILINGFAAMIAAILSITDYGAAARLMCTSIILCHNCPLAPLIFCHE